MAISVIHPCGRLVRYTILSCMYAIYTKHCLAKHDTMAHGKPHEHSGPSCPHYQPALPKDTEDVKPETKKHVQVLHDP